MHSFFSNNIIVNAWLSNPIEYVRIYVGKLKVQETLVLAIIIIFI